MRNEHVCTVFLQELFALGRFVGRVQVEMSLCKKTACHGTVCSRSCAKRWSVARATTIEQQQHTNHTQCPNPNTHRNTQSLHTLFHIPKEIFWRVHWCISMVEVVHLFLIFVQCVLSHSLRKP